MPDEQKSAEQVLQELQAAVAMGNEQFVRDTNDIIELGHESYQNFDTSVEEFADAVGRDKVAEISAMMLNFQNPAALIEYYASHPAEAKKLSQMSPGARAAAIARTEMTVMPNAAEAAGTEPAWRRQVRGGKASRDMNDPAISDQDFERLWKKKWPGGWVPPRNR
jgi:hypothetical protein